MRSKPSLHFAPLTLLATVLATAAAVGQDAANPPSRPLAPAAPLAPGNALFESLPAEVIGIRHVPIPDLASLPFPHYRGTSMEAGGVALGDLDGDQRPDLFIAGAPGANRLYRQSGDWKFEDVTATAGLDGDLAWSRGAAMADVDNDGDLDLFVANHDAPNQLFINHGRSGEGQALRFTEEAAARGVALVDASQMPAFCDFDHDGDLDFYLLTHQYQWEGPPPASSVVVMREGRPTIAPEYEKFFGISLSKEGTVSGKPVGRRDFFYRNDGSGKFTEVGAEVGIEATRGRGLSASWWDYNNDGWLDLYVGNDWEDADSLYRNNGDGTFTNTIRAVVPHTTWFSMGSDSGDLNNDGFIDLLSADMSGTTHYKRKVSMGAMDAKLNEFLTTAKPPQYMRNAVYLGTGTEHVLEAAYLCGLANSDWSWACKIRDFDCDGLQDVFITNAMEMNIAAPETGAGPPSTPELRKERNLAFHNEGNLHFSETGAKWGLDFLGLSYSSACGDLDGDGDLDLVVVNLGAAPLIYRNNSDRNRISLRLVGTSSNRYGLGARVRVETPGGPQTHLLLSARGYLASDQPLLNIGLGNQPTVSRLSVEWPSGQIDQYENLTANHHYTLTESVGAQDRPPAGSVAEHSTYRSTKVLEIVGHREKAFDDFALQSLLPNKLSQLGPGLAVGDLNGDGREDLARGGANGQPTQIFLKQPDGSFKTSSIPNTIAFEDLGLLLIDVDSDRDLDLFVVSGGVEVPPGNIMLRDRLYLNDGTGRFSGPNFNLLPDRRDSGGPAVAADFDRDGDLDLFVGGRVLPGRYPRSPESVLLLNEGGTFSDVTERLAPELRTAGMVTGAVFSDLDNDGWQDLVLSLEWNSPMVFRNREGSFENQSGASGFASLRGWWQSVEAGDLDSDGDIDLVMGNFGLNTKYHASFSKPVHLFVGKFGTDQDHIVEAEYEDEHLFPVRGKSCTTQAIPNLREKFPTFHQFAQATLPEIYAPAVLEQAERYDASVLSSAIFLNDGSGNFEFRELPPLAQIAPVFGIALTDANADGSLDLVLAQNFFNPQPETGRMAGGLSLLLEGDGTGRFAPVWPKESGIGLPVDAKSLVQTDLDEDGQSDLVFGVNSGQARAFLTRPREGIRVLQVTLEGAPGNPTGIGARVSFELDDGSTRIREIQAGGGYLSQSSPRCDFALPRDREVKRISVRWPNGTSKSYGPPATGNQLTLRP